MDLVTCRLSVFAKKRKESNNSRGCQLYLPLIGLWMGVSQGGRVGVSEGGRVGVVERYYKLQRYKKVPMDEQIKIQMIKWQTP